ncbi:MULTISPECIES: proline racemase family protein [Bacillus]|uniref:proline racemase family protein n=1 Tax=Bacillus TaxID=1386 RepID=UPI0003813A59|nr:MULTISPECIES: proline racemase family protein [Bacillus]
MKATKVFTTIDTHTGGNPTRTVLSGIPKLPGKTMAENMLYMKENLDWIRKFLMFEPRGHDVMSGALMVEPCHPEADFGVIYIETGGYLPMCGHDTIGFCTAIVEAGLVELKEPITKLKLDTPAGLVDVEISIENGKAKHVSFCNIPAFFLKHVEVEIEELGLISCDIAYGGNFYGIIDAKTVHLELLPENASIIVETAVKIRDIINSNFEVVHPQFPFINGLTHIEFYSEPTDPSATVKNTVIVPPGGIDRSPCGTGTSAKLATLYSYNQIEIDEVFVHESIVGSLFNGKIITTTSVADVQAVITQISGSAWITGMHQLFYQPEDHIGAGFLLIPEMKEH